MKRTPTPSSKLSDARLKALLRALREEPAAPEGFSARVLDSLRAQGMLPRASKAPAPAAEARPSFGAALRSWLGGSPWAASVPRWGLAAAALALAVGLGLWPRHEAPTGPLPAVDPGRAVPAPSAVRPAPRVLAASAGHARPHAPALARAQASAPAPAPSGAPLRMETDLALSSSSAPGQAPQAGRGSEAAASPARSLAWTAQGPSGAAGGGGSGAGTVFMGGGSGRSGLDKPASTPTPSGAGPTPTPGLGSNSQVRNNVILASRGQSAQILFKVAQAGTVEVAIYSRLGVRVAVLQDGSMGPGQYSLYWNGQSEFGGMAASGIYAVLIRTPTYTDLDKVMLVK